MFSDCAGDSLELLLMYTCTLGHVLTLSVWGLGVNPGLLLEEHPMFGEKNRKKNAVWSKLSIFSSV